MNKEIREQITEIAEKLDELNLDVSNVCRELSDNCFDSIWAGLLDKRLDLAFDFLHDIKSCIEEALDLFDFILDGE